MKKKNNNYYILRHCNMKPQLITLRTTL